MKNETTAEPEIEKPDIAKLALDYAETYYELAMVNVHQKTADISAVVSFGLLATVMTGFIILFLGIAGALWLGTLLGSNTLGFLAITLLYILLLAFFYLTRNKLFFPFIKNAIVKSIYD